MKPNHLKQQRRRTHAEAQRQAMIESMRRQADIDRVMKLMRMQPHLNDQDIARATAVDADVVRQLRNDAHA